MIEPRFKPEQLPERFRRLPLDERGYPVPAFVQWVDGLPPGPAPRGVGYPDFRVMDHHHWLNCVDPKKQLCWLCGEPLGQYRTFVIGPMCSINLVTVEPPNHHACATFAAKACPFLSNPMAKRNMRDLPDGRHVPGISIDRNPGVSCLWTVKRKGPFPGYRVFEVDGKVTGSGKGQLLEIFHKYEKVEWYAEGRTATYEEVVKAIDTGLPNLQDIAHRQGKPAEDELVRRLARYIRSNVLPKEEAAA